MMVVRLHSACIASSFMAMSVACREFICKQTHPKYKPNPYKVSASIEKIKSNKDNKLLIIFLSLSSGYCDALRINSSLASSAESPGTEVLQKLELPQAVKRSPRRGWQISDHMHQSSHIYISTYLNTSQPFPQPQPLTVDLRYFAVTTAVLATVKPRCLDGLHRLAPLLGVLSQQGLPRSCGDSQMKNQ